MKQIFLCIILLVMSKAEASLPKEAFDHIYLYEWGAKEKKVTNKEKLEKNRIHIQFSKIQKKWLYTLTNSEGKLPEKMVFIGSGSVLPGRYIGIHSKKQDNYLLEENGKWKKTEETGKIISFGEEANSRMTIQLFESANKKIPKLVWKK